MLIFLKIVNHPVLKIRSLIGNYVYDNNNINYISSFERKYNYAELLNYDLNPLKKIGNDKISGLTLGPYTHDN